MYGHNVADLLETLQAARPGDTPVSRYGGPDLDEAFIELAAALANFVQAAAVTGPGGVAGASGTLVSIGRDLLAAAGRDAREYGGGEW